MPTQKEASGFLCQRGLQRKDIDATQHYDFGGERKKEKKKRKKTGLTRARTGDLIGVNDVS